MAATIKTVFWLTSRAILEKCLGRYWEEKRGWIFLSFTQKNSLDKLSRKPREPQLCRPLRLAGGRTRAAPCAFPHSHLEKTKKIGDGLCWMAPRGTGNHTITEGPGSKMPETKNKGRGTSDLTRPSDDAKVSAPQVWSKTWSLPVTAEIKITSPVNITKK